MKVRGDLSGVRSTQTTGQTLAYTLELNRPAYTIDEAQSERPIAPSMPTHAPPIQVDSDWYYNH